jgi:hypothetical protein
MNLFGNHFDILSKLYQTYDTNINIILKYNTSYTNAFHQALKDSYKKMENKDNYNKFNSINFFFLCII